MAQTHDSLGQSAPAAATNTDAYTVPAATQTVLSSLVVCNRGSTMTTFRIALRKDGAAIANAHYLYYDVPIPGNDTFVLTGGVTMGATDVITVYAGNANLTFNVFGVEIT